MRGRRETLKTVHKLLHLSSYLEFDTLLFNFVINLLPDCLFFNSFARPRIARAMGLKCGDRCQIRRPIYFESHRRIILGDDVLLNRQSYFDAGGGIVIGDHVKFGPQVMVVTGTHQIGDTNMRMGRTRPAGIRIETGCWIGGRVTITAGVTIGRGCVISAGSVVQRTMPPDFVIAGNPARMVQALDASHPEAARSSSGEGEPRAQRRNV